MVFNGRICSKPSKVGTSRLVTWSSIFHLFVIRVNQLIKSGCSARSWTWKIRWCSKSSQLSSIRKRSFGLIWRSILAPALTIAMSSTLLRRLCRSRTKSTSSWILYITCPLGTATSRSTPKPPASTLMLHKILKGQKTKNLRARTSRSS